jgi:Na+-driven multidrug efflux pump
VKFKFVDFIPQLSEVILVCKLGFNSFIYQLSNLLVQVTLNNTLRIYGEDSVYGADTPIAVAGIVSKINVIFIAVIIGLINGAQPICSYSYGVKKYKAVTADHELVPDRGDRYLYHCVDSIRGIFKTYHIVDWRC